MAVIYSIFHDWEMIALEAKEELDGQPFVFCSFILHEGLHLACGFFGRKEKLQLTN